MSKLWVVTEAPEVYDYETAATVDQVRCHDCVVRLVEVTTDYPDAAYVANYQADRYWSGNFAGRVYDTLSAGVNGMHDVAMFHSRTLD